MYSSHAVYRNYSHCITCQEVNKAFCKRAVRPPYKCLHCTEFYTISACDLHFILAYVGSPSPTEKYLSLVVLWQKKHFHLGYFYQIREEKTSYRTVGRVSELCCLTYSLSLYVSVQSPYNLQNVAKAELSGELRQVVTCLRQCLRLCAKGT